jgi:hypothetical protein
MALHLDVSDRRGLSRVELMFEILTPSEERSEDAVTLYTASRSGELCPLYLECAECKGRRSSASQDRRREDRFAKLVVGKTPYVFEFREPKCIDRLKDVFISV